jgi:hypothetical protein
VPGSSNDIEKHLGGSLRPGSFPPSLKRIDMNQKVREAINKNEIDLDDINSWASILQTTEEEVAKTKLARWSPRDLYILEKEDSNGFNSVWTTVPAELKVPARKLLHYLQEINLLNKENVHYVSLIYEETTARERKLEDKLHQRDSFLEDTPIMPKNVSEWLNSLKLNQYVNNFMENGYDDLYYLIKFGLNDDKLNTMNIKLPGHRKVLCASLKELRK